LNRRLFFKDFVRAGQNITVTTDVNWYSPDFKSDKKPNGLISMSMPYTATLN
jgi:hypothetical protein